MKILTGLLSVLFLTIAMMANGQTTMKGVVSDSKTGSLLNGVSIKEVGTTNGAITDKEGSFTIALQGGNDTLIFSFLGYFHKKVPINGRTNIEVELTPSSQSLNELIVTGYTKQKKADLTGSISVVSGEELHKDHGTTNILKSLQGKVPGMHITTDGNPTGNVGIQIRGITSVNSAPPLIVIDGVPTHVNLNDINASNIESIQVLKDASSASIYGAQAASGVVLIETKKGKPGKTKVSYSGSFGVARLPNNVKLLNTQEYGRALWRAAVNDGRDPNDISRIYDYDWHKNSDGNPVLDKVTPVKWLNSDHTMPSANTDWIGAATQLGLQNNHQITVSGGSKKSTSLLSLNFYQNRGTQIHTGLRRFTVRFNSEYSLINDHLTIGENLAASNLKINDQNAMHDIMVEPSIVPVHTTDGGWGGSARGLGMDDYWNPVRELTLNKDNNHYSNMVVGGLYAELNFLENFNLKSQLGINYNQGNYRTIDFTFVEGGGQANHNSAVNQGDSRSLLLNFANTLQYSNHIGLNDINVLLGIEARKFTTGNMDVSRQDILFENYNYAYLSNATGNKSTEASGDKFRNLSYFGKVNYVYNSKYLFSATLRYDGSSKFGANNKYGLFPAVSAGWRISNEDFLKYSEVVSNLKFRVSWGKNGNSNIPTTARYSYFRSDYNLTSYGISGAKTGDLPSGYLRMQTGNQNLRWESTQQTNIGVDFGLFNQKLTGSIDLYNKYTEGMLFNPPYLGAIGEGGSMWYNAADMTNRGIGISLSYHSNTNKDFRYSISGSISHNSNKINDLPEAVRFAYGGNGIDEDIQGRSINSIYGYVADGIFKTKKEVDNHADQPGKGIGRIRYKDLNGDGKITAEKDRTWIGNTDPKVEFGITFNASYKAFDFSMFWQGLMGNLVHDGWKAYSDFWNVWLQSGFNHPKRILNAWSPDNPNSNIPALTLTNPNNELRESTYFIESGSYLKMRNIEVGYNFPTHILQKLSMRKLRVYVSVQNLVNIKKWWGDNAFTGPDPENPSGENYFSPYLRPQIFKVGIGISF